MIYWGLLLFFVLEYVRPSSYIPALAVMKLNTLVPVLSALGSLVSGRGRVATQQLFSEPQTKLLLAFLGLIVVSVLTADVTDYAWTIFTAVLGYFLVFWVIAQQVTTLARVKGLFKTLVLVHLVVTALNPQIFDGGRQYVAAGYFLGDGNDFALSVNIAIPLCLFLVLDAAGMRQRLFYIGALLILVFDVVATQSRGGTVALACVGLYYWIKSDRKITMTMIVTTAMVMVLLAAPAGYFERMSGVADSEEGSAKGRIEAWTAAIQMALDNPILGVGAGHFSVMHGARYRSSFDSPPNQTAHSIYFLVLGDLGLPGLALFLSVIWTNLAANRRLARQLEVRGQVETAASRQLLSSSSASLIAYATGGAFLSAAYYPHLFVIAGLMTAARRVATARLTTPASAPPRKSVGVSPYFVPRQVGHGSPTQVARTRDALS